MEHRTRAVGLTAVLLLASCSTQRDDRPLGGHGITPPANPVRAMVRGVTTEVSAQRLRGDVDRLASFGTRHTMSDRTSDTRGVGAAARWIKSEFEKAAAERARLGLTPMQVYLEPHRLEPDGRRIDVPVEIQNVVAVIPGRLEATGQAERIYISGHYDSRNGNEMDRTGDAPGANDDASGTAVAIELCRVLSKREFDHTIILVAFDAEEAGLYGSRKHVEKAAGENAMVRAVLNNDIVGDPWSPDGRETRNHIRLYSEGLQAGPISGDSIGGRPGSGAGSTVERLRREGALGDSTSRQLARYVYETAWQHHTEVRPIIIFRADRFLRGGDHTPFHDAGYAAVRFTEVDEDYNRQHQDVRVEKGVRFGDVPKFVDENYLAGVTRLNGATAACLASAPTAPADARIITAVLSNNTTLRWSPSPDPDAAGYEVVWRETTSPVWNYVVDAGDATEATVPMSKDNVFFGVRCYDREGYRSVVSFAYAARE
jgi:Zn-dependent M28 family amino/carboxypeptidase